jgi:hypothetical protein
MLRGTNTYTFPVDEKEFGYLKMQIILFSFWYADYIIFPCTLYIIASSNLDVLVPPRAYPISLHTIESTSSIDFPSFTYNLYPLVEVALFDYI